MSPSRYALRGALLQALSRAAEEAADAASDLDGILQAAQSPRAETAGLALAELYRQDALDPLKAALMECERHYHDLLREHQLALAEAEIDAGRAMRGVQ